jgi:hypothetical protein
MKRYRVIFVPLALVLLLFSAGCLQEHSPGSPAGLSPAKGHDMMLHLLRNVTEAVQENLSALDAATSGAAEVFRTTGISGPAADTVLAKVAASHPAVINVIAYDQNGTVSAAEPGSAKFLLGTNLSGYGDVQKALTTRQPLMSKLVGIAQGVDGVVIARPVFSSSEEFTGVCSMGFSPDTLVRPIAEAASSGTPCTFMVVEPGGMVLYDPDPVEVGRETFNETLYGGSPEFLDLVRHYTANRTGYHTYSFYRTGFGEVVSKETFWDTVELHGMEWRVLVTREQ